MSTTVASNNLVDGGHIDRCTTNEIFRKVQLAIESIENHMLPQMERENCSWCKILDAAFTVIPELSHVWCTNFLGDLFSRLNGMVVIGRLSASNAVEILVWAIAEYKKKRFAL